MKILPKDRNGWIQRILLSISLLASFFLPANPIMAQRTPADCLASSTDPASVASKGCWQTLPEKMEINPIHMGMLHTGKVLVLAGSGALASDLDEHILKAAVWDPLTGTIAIQDLQYDMWCNGMAFLPDGRALIVGGTESYGPPSFEGEARASIFDPLTEQFYQVQSMQNGRWYATVTALGDGQLLTFSGLDQTGNVNSLIENYKIAFGWDPQSQSPWTPPLYPWLHLLPDGRLFYSGYTNNSRFYDPVSKTWSVPPIPTIYNLDPGRVYGSSMLLPLLAPNYTPRVMNLGGANLPNGGTAPLNSPAVATTEIIDLSSLTPQWVAGPLMSVPRVHMNAVLLPTGKVLALGGSLTSETPDFPGTGGFLTDLIDPVLGGTTTSAGVAQFARLYHSMAMLLPDATVLVAGSNPVTFANREYEKNMEIYSPAYLFTGDGVGPSTPATRPTILNAPSIIGYGGTFDVQTDSSQIGSVVLIRPGSPTHAFDMEQRMVKLSFTPGPNNTLTVTAPPSVNSSPSGANIAPPGYYMLFVLNNLGVPSVATFIQLSLNPLNQNPEGTITSPANDDPILTSQQIEFNGSADNPNNSPQLTFSWVFPDATPDGSNSPSAGPVTVSFPTPGTYVVSLTVADSTGASDPSPPTHTVTVIAPPAVTLTIVKTVAAGAGGTVTSNPAGINCGPTCNHSYDSGASVTLTATADPNSTFNGWSGGWCSGTGTCVPTLNHDTTVTANFIITPVTLNITKTGAGSGTVTSNPAGINCGPTCSNIYNFGQSVTLTAVANLGSVFNGWSGGGCSGTSTCQPTLNGDPTSVTAEFIIPPTVTLNITKTGAGTGTVTSNPAGINCGVDCTEPYSPSAVVTLTATAAAGSAFTGWSGGSCSDTSPCQPTFNSDPITVTANFIIVPPLTLATSPLPDAEVGVSYSKPLLSGGLPLYTITTTKGAFPTGLSPDPNNGALAGTPMPSKGGSFTVQVNYPSGGPVTGSFKIKILSALGVSTKSLKSGTHGKSYKGTLKATGGKAPYTWSLAPGSSLPPGLILSSAGAITGVVDPAPAAIGTYNFTVQVTDPVKATDPVNSTVSKNLTLTIK
jgi:hypothetical protein